MMEKTDLRGLKKPGPSGEFIYTVSYWLTGGEPYALKGARTVRWGVH